ncbi:hypothetical protein C8R46DRAFT_1026362 [Mycena filopes]|nr:hypothetical protein C8R46DRAFT_1026362 [Mycena filopes]
MAQTPETLIFRDVALSLGQMTDNSPLELAQAFIEAVTSGNLELVAALMADDFIWEMFPATLGIPAKDKRQYLLQSAELGAIFAWFRIHLRDPLHVVQAGESVVMHASSPCFSPVASP